MKTQTEVSTVSPVKGVDRGTLANDCFLKNICSEKQILSRFFDYLRTAKNF